MKEKIAAMKAELSSMIAKSKAIVAQAEGKPEDAELQKLLSQNITDCKKLREQISELEALNSMDAYLSEPEGKRRTAGLGDDVEPSLARWGNAKNFRRESKAESNGAAYRFGMWAAAVLGDPDGDFTGKARKYCQENGIELKTMKETVNVTGGFLVPPEFDADLIDLREVFGVFRRNARIVPMMRDTKSIGRRTAGLTAYFVGEATAPTESEKTFDLVTLTARKLMTLTRISSELNEDAIISLADNLFEEIAYAFANKEDECGFNGDGTSTFGGIDGLRNRLKTIYTASGGVGLVVGAGASYSALTLANFNSVVGSLPEYADGRAKWYVSRFFWATVMQRLAVAAGGVTAEEIEGKRMRTFLGYPVEIAQAMPKTTASAQVCAVFGDLKLSSRFGDRRQTLISASDQRYFDTDEIGIKGSERFDIVNHDCGDTTNAGPVVGLITA